MSAAARWRMIMPGPARRHVDFEADLAAQALAGGRLAERHRLRLFCRRVVFGEHAETLRVGHPFLTVIARSHRVGAKRRPMTGSATKQSILSLRCQMDCFA